MSRELIIGIDETGSFHEQKLGQGRGISGLAAVASWSSKADLRARLSDLARAEGVAFPQGMHARELHDRERRDADEGSTARFLSKVQALVASNEPFRAGIRGKLPGREFFHEQQSYGEKLLGLLALIADAHRDVLRAADQITVYVATRSAVALTGFVKEGSDYHYDLCAYLGVKARSLGWPRTTRFVPDYANQNAILMLADFAAWELRSHPAWGRAASSLRLPSIYETTKAELLGADRVSLLLYKLHRGDRIASRDLGPAASQTARETLRRLTAAAHSLVTDRHGAGSLAKARTLIDLLWPLAEAHGAQRVQGELCQIAAELFSHLGHGADDRETASWRGRADALPATAWGASGLEAQANRLHGRCQTVQLDAFNVFAFDDVLVEFWDLKEKYEAQVGIAQEDAADDELYGKILGTLAQASGFYRAQDAEVGAEVWGLLESSRRQFGASIPLYRLMNLGFRLTDLWDRGELDQAEALMVREKPPEADPYSLLHRLRVAAFRRHRAEPHEPPEPMIARLLAVSARSETIGLTPWDLCLKWALFLSPEDADLQEAAASWLGGLGDGQPALQATSLALAAQLGLFANAEATLAELLMLPGFADHWSTPRAAALTECIAERTSPTFEALRAMPWNYA